MPIYQVGDTVTLPVEFRVAGVLTDPTDVSLVVRKPDGTQTTYAYSLAEVTKTATGIYTKSIIADAAGLWTWKWTGTGTAAGIDEGDFTVEATLLGAPRLCSVDDVRTYLQKPTGDTAQNDVISVLIGRASHAIMGFTGREFMVDGTNPATRTFDIGVYARLAHTTGLPTDDLQAIPTAASIIDAAGTTVTTLTPATDLVPLPMNRHAWQPINYLRLRPAIAAPSPDDILSVTGSWGWPQVPEDVRQACVVTVGLWMRREVQAFTTTFNLDEGRLERPQALPSMAIDMLRRYRYPGVA